MGLPAGWARAVKRVIYPAVDRQTTGRVPDPGSISPPSRGSVRAVALNWSCWKKRDQRGHSQRKYKLRPIVDRQERAASDATRIEFDWADLVGRGPSVQC